MSPGALGWRLGWALWADSAAPHAGLSCRAVCRAPEGGEPDPRPWPVLKFPGPWPSPWPCQEPPWLRLPALGWGLFTPSCEQDTKHPWWAAPEMSLFPGLERAGTSRVVTLGCQAGTLGGWGHGVQSWVGQGSRNGAFSSVFRAGLPAACAPEGPIGGRAQILRALPQGSQVGHFENPVSPSPRFVLALEAGPVTPFCRLRRRSGSRVLCAKPGSEDRRPCRVALIAAPWGLRRPRGPEPLHFCVAGADLMEFLPQTTRFRAPAHPGPSWAPCPPGHLHLL